jgi:tetratricopeptide (TPR) repeat protein
MNSKPTSTKPEPTDAERVRDVFSRLAGSAPDTWEPGVVQALPDREDLHSQVLALLRADADSETNATIDSIGETLRGSLHRCTEESDPLLGETIGRYTLVERIGEGTFGAVFLAQQNEPVSRQVACKVLHPGMGSPRVFRRFQRERDLLATLRHPGIAGILDAGTTPDGRPYFVMPLVDGRHLHEYCVEDATPQNQRIELFIKACDAVQHAHGRGVLHRDLKPNNIIVDEQADHPRPVIIDFGIATAVTSEPGDTVTAHGEQLGTPNYMSPEQRRGEAVDVTSDVYSLGVTLRELVAARPFEPGGDSSDRKEPAPIPRELGWIIERCCRDEPEDRYASVSELSADLRRYLDGLPLLAKPQGSLYHVAKYARRHKLLTLLLCIVPVAIAGWIVTAQRANQRLEAELDAQTELISGMMDDVLSRVSVLLGAEAARVSLVEQLLSRVDHLLDSRPDDETLLRMKAKLLMRLGHSGIHGSDPEQAARLNQQALDIYAGLAERRIQDIPFLREHAQAFIHVGDCSLSTGEHEEAATHYRHALTLQMDAHREHGTDVGLRDDLTWSYDRLYPFTDGDERRAHLAARLALAEALVDEDRIRSLSLFTLLQAHARYAVHFQYAEEDRDLAISLEHAHRAAEFADELVALEPRRSAYLRARVESRIRIAELNVLLEEAAPAKRASREAERLLDDIPTAEFMMFRTRHYAVLTRLYHLLGLQDDARACALKMAGLVEHIERDGGEVIPDVARLLPEAYQLGGLPERNTP